MATPRSKTSFYGIKKGMDIFGLLKLGFSEADNISKFVISFYFYWKNIFALFGYFSLDYFNLLLSHRAPT
jgi:hypothetical protein